MPKYKPAYETTEAQDTTLLDIARAASGAAIVEQNEDGTIHVNAFGGAGYWIDVEGNCTVTRLPREQR